MALESYLRGEVAQDFVDGLMTRREAIRRLALLGMSLTGASALLAACGGDSDSDESAEPGTEPATTTSSATSTTAAAAEDVRFAGPRGQLIAAFAQPTTAPNGAILVIHENGGLTAHFRELVGRFATQGYAALCVDLLSHAGGTAAQTDQGAVSAALSAAPVEEVLGDLRAGIDYLQQQVPGANIGVVGFCFGGGMTWQLLHAGEARIAAAVPFYGPTPDDPDFSEAKAAVLGVYAERDSRVNATRAAADAALEKAGLTFEIRTFEDADHAFFNDTGSRYDAAAATAASEAMLDWFSRHL